MTTLEEFSQFWARYPKKRARDAALKAYKKARLRATAAELLAGLERYIAHMTADVQFRPHGGTWLTQGRWLDEYEDEAPPPSRPDADWFEECKEIHGGACGLDRYQHGLRKSIGR